MTLQAGVPGSNPLSSQFNAHILVLRHLISLLLLCDARLLGSTLDEVEQLSSLFLLTDLAVVLRARFLAVSVRAGAAGGFLFVI